MTVRRLPPLLLALVVGVLCAVAVACGDDGDDRSLISPSRASEIKDELDTISERVERGRCDELDPAFIRLDRAVDGLPPEADRRLRRRLADGVENLRSISRDECRDNRPETTETTETTETETVPETVPTETLPPETTPPPQTTPPPTQEPPAQTTPPEPEPEEPVLPEDVPPEGTGGDQAPGAFVPPGQAKKGKRG